MRTPDVGKPGAGLPSLRMSRTLVIFGLLVVGIGLLWPLLAKLGLGRLPGDLYIERPTFSFYFPIMTSILVSLAISIILWLINR